MTSVLTVFVESNRLPAGTLLPAPERLEDFF